jgi:hypothetical protein
VWFPVDFDQNNALAVQTFDSFFASVPGIPITLGNPIEADGGQYLVVLTA